MRSCLVRWLIVLTVTLLNLSAAQEKENAKTEKPKVEAESEAEFERRVQNALSQTHHLKYQQIPLSDVVDDLKNRSGIDFLLDRKALGDAGIGTDTSIEVDLKSVSLRSGLKLILAEHDLTWMIRHRAIFVTSLDMAESRLTTRVYDLEKLGRLSLGLQNDDELLIDVIQRTIRPDLWEYNGGPCSLQAVAGKLVVSQTAEVHNELADLLNTIHRFKSGTLQTHSVAIDERTQAIHEKLDESINYSHEEIALSDLAVDLSKLNEINIVIDRKALEDSGTAADVPSSVKARNIPLKSVMRRVLEPHDLTYIVRNEAVIVTTPDQAESHLSIRLYSLKGLGLEATSKAFDSDGLPSVAARKLESLKHLIQYTIRPETWANAGGTGELAILPAINLLVVSQTAEIHEQIDDLLRQLRDAIARSDSSAQKVANNASTPPEADATDDQAAAAEDSVQLVVYEIKRLPDGHLVYSAEQLARLIQKAIEPNSWLTQQGAFVEPLEESVLVRHKASVQKRIRRLLDHMNAVPEPSRELQGGFFHVPHRNE